MAERPAMAPDLALVRRMLDEDHHRVEAAEQFAKLRRRRAWPSIERAARAWQHEVTEALAGEIRRRSGG